MARDKRHSVEATAYLVVDGSARTPLVVSNISLGGLCVVAPPELFLREHVCLAFLAHGLRSVVVDARVVWSDTRGYTGLSVPSPSPEWLELVAGLAAGNGPTRPLHARAS